MRKKNLKYLIVASHRRSGTHWLIDTLFNNFEEIQHGYFNMDRIIPGSKKYMTTKDFLDNIRDTDKIRILKTHTPASFELFKDIPEKKNIIENEILPYSKILYIYRDCRDVMLSLYFYLNGPDSFDILSFNSFLEEFHELDKIDNRMNRLEFHKYHIDGWMKQKGILFIKYEDLYFADTDTLIKLEKFTGIALRSDPIKIKLKKYNKIQRGIRRILPRLFSTTAVEPGKGIVGDWENYSDNDTIKIYEKYCGENSLPDLDKKNLNRDDV